MCVRSSVCPFVHSFIRSFVCSVQALNLHISGSDIHSFLLAVSQQSLSSLYIQSRGLQIDFYLKFKNFGFVFCGSIKVTSVSDVSSSMNALSTARDNLGLVKGKQETI